MSRIVEAGSGVLMVTIGALARRTELNCSINLIILLSNSDSDCHPAHDECNMVQGL